MNPLKTIQAMWKDPKRRPWLLAAGGLGGGLAVFTLRRPADPNAAAAEDTAAAADPSADPSLPPDSYGGVPDYSADGYGYVGPSGLGMGYDPSFVESGVLADLAPKLDALGTKLQEQARRRNQRVTKQVTAVKKRQTAIATRQSKQLKKVAKSERQLRREVKRLRTRAGHGPHRGKGRHQK